MTAELEYTSVPAGIDPETGEQLYTFDLDPNVPAEEITIAFLAGKVDALTAQVELLIAQQEGIAGMLATVVEQVGPTLDQLSSHPMFKMIFGGK